MIGLTFAAIALLSSLGYAICNGSAEGSIRVPPGKAVVLSWCTDDALCVLIDLGAVMLLHRIFVLCIHISAANFDGVQFIGTDAPEQHLLAACLRVE